MKKKVEHPPNKIKYLKNKVGRNYSQVTLQTKLVS